VEVPLLVNDFLRRAAKLYPTKTAIVDGKNRYTYRQYQERVNQMSHALRGLGVGKGDRVCILSPNSHYFLESYYAVAQLGAIMVPLNYRLIAADHEYCINHSGTKVLIADREYTGVVEEIRPNLEPVEHYLSAWDDGDAPDGWQDLEGLMSGQSTSPPPAIEQDENDVTSINYTSGTTARPKGVMLTHRNCYINAFDFIAHLGVNHNDVELWTLPMFHANGWGGPFALTAVGARHVVLRTVIAEDIYRLIENEGVTFACMAPAVLNTILSYENKDKHQIKTRPRFVIAGAPPPSAFVKRLEEDLGWEFMEIYGLTETAPILTVNRPDHNLAEKGGDDPYKRRSRAGVEGIGTEIQVMGSDGKPVPMDDTSIGEIAARSNVVFKGYWNNQEATDEAIRDGYFYTGDLATWDEYGNVNIVDRQKDVIISGGENISSAEVEAALHKHPAVMDVAVVGVPSDKWGETPRAIVVKRDGAAVTEEELLAFSRDNLAHFKCPTGVDFVDALPRTATGKIQKFVIREKFWTGTERRVN
jgi:acyl-CoA synthetase (AMP-forming)/AMP-acid ligase II